jgi:hypothetical protein
MRRGDPRGRDDGLVDAFKTPVDRFRGDSLPDDGILDYLDRGRSINNLEVVWRCQRSSQ